MERGRYVLIRGHTQVSRAFLKSDFETCVSETLKLLNEYFAVESAFSGKALDRSTLHPTHYTLHTTHYTLHTTH